MSTESPFYDVTELNALLGVHRITLDRWERRGLFPRRCRVGQRTIFWRKADVDDWARSPEDWARRNANGGV